jgi:hypothetical protein
MSILSMGRLITDNFLVAYESYHAIKKEKHDKYGLCAIKIYMHKSYDQVEWSFMKRIMVWLGFEMD